MVTISFIIMNYIATAELFLLERIQYISTTEVQYCAKVMLTKFAIYRALFSRYFAEYL